MADDLDAIVASAQREREAAKRATGGRFVRRGDLQAQREAELRAHIAPPPPPPQWPAAAAAVPAAAPEESAEAEPAAAAAAAASPAAAAAAAPAAAPPPPATAAAARRIAPSVQILPVRAEKRMYLDCTIEEFDVDAHARDKAEFVYHVLRKLLVDWDAQIARRTAEEQKAAAARVDLRAYHQCKTHVKPLFLLLKHKQCDAEVLSHLRAICALLRARRYVSANDRYLQLAIGNAPWPMGVTMVGIHERKSRERISQGSVAHVLNDETQRKYVQAVKRLMTCCETLYPSDDSAEVTKW